MAKFLNKKEQVLDFKLTPYGKYLLSIGTFKPTYYALFDDNILYDGGYAGLNENQNTAHERIKEGTPYLESLVLFENVEQPGNYTKEGEPTFRQSQLSIEQGNTAASAEAFHQTLSDTYAQAGGATHEQHETLASFGAYFQKGSFATVLDLPRKDSLKFTSMIGDAYLDGETQAAPSWKIVALQGEIEESTQKDIENDLEIPQINIELDYTKKVVPYSIEVDPTNIRDINDRAAAFINNEMIQLVMDDALIYADEVNTELLTENFEIDVFEIVEEFPGAVASSSIMYNYCNDTNLTISAGQTLTIDEPGRINPKVFYFRDGSATGPTDVDISDPLLVLQKMQEKINSQMKTVSASLGPLVPCEEFTGPSKCSDGSSCYSSLIVSKTQVGRQGGASAHAFGTVKPTVITTNERAGITLDNAQVTDPTAAVATILMGAVSLDDTITLVSTDGTSKTYTAKNSQDLGSNYFNRAGTEGGSYFQQAAQSLKACIEGSAGHNGKILVELEVGPTVNVSHKLILTQAEAGPNGNKSITNDFTCPNPNGCDYPSEVDATFGGGSLGSSRTVLRGGMDKRVTFLRKYFEKEQPQIVDGFLQSPTPVVNAPASYTTSSVEYYFDILVDSEIEQRIACKSAEAFNKQSYYVDLDFDCEEIEQDFVYADIYGRVTDPEICQT
tara:strand:- start:1198 stop:3210 length:2013 start_codon:yes stop_codon:yes gene_type:complete